MGPYDILYTIIYVILTHLTENEMYHSMYWYLGAIIYLLMSFKIYNLSKSFL